MKKIICLLLAVQLFCIPAFALKGIVTDPNDLPYLPPEGTQETPASGESPSSWAAGEVAAAEEAGLVPQLTGSPAYQDTITREQFAELAVQMVETALGRALPADPAGTFSDCTNPAVRKASRAGIVTGVGDGRFDPATPTNREQIAAMIHRAITCLERENKTDYVEKFEDLSLYTDVDQISSWAVQSMGILAHNRIMLGTSDTLISPKTSCTVEQAILLLYRVYGRT